MILGKTVYESVKPIIKVGGRNALSLRSANLRYSPTVELNPIPDNPL